MRTAADTRVGKLDLDAVLLQVLAILNPHTKGRLPTLVDRYLSRRPTEPDAVTRFGACVLDVIRYRGVGCWDVQRAIASIEDNYSNSRLTQEAIADRLDLAPTELSVLFARHTGETFTTYLRQVRLNRAAFLLASETVSIKEVWTQVGYNDASNFTHQFKERFGVSPRDYRASVIHTPESMPAHVMMAAGSRSPFHPVLIVEDNDETRTTLTRNLQQRGFSITAAATGQSAFHEATRATPAAIVIDQHLPDTEGIDWLRAYRQSRTDATAPAVLFTADLEVDEDGAELQRLDATFVSKLCDLEDVELLVESLVTMQRTSDATAREPRRSRGALFGLRKSG